MPPKILDRVARLEGRVARLDNTMAEAHLFDAATRMDEMRLRIDGALKDVQSMCSNYTAEFKEKIAEIAAQHKKYLQGNVRLRRFIEDSRTLMGGEVTEMKELLASAQDMHQNNRKFVETAQGMVSRDVVKAEQLVARSAAQRKLEERLQMLEEMVEELTTKTDQRSLLQEVKEELNNLSFVVSEHESSIENLGNSVNLVKNPRPTLDHVVRIAQAAAKSRRHRSVSVDNGGRRPGGAPFSHGRVSTSSEDELTTRTAYNTSVLRELRRCSRGDPSTHSRSSSTDSFGSVRTAP